MTELYDTVYPPRKPIVNDLLYSGTYLFVGAPKVGKSFFMGQLAYHVAMGLPLWEYEVHQGTVLYLALEDDYARLQRRLSRMFGVEETSNLYFATQAKSVSEGLDQQLEGFIREHPDVRLIIIDTLQKVREIGGDRYSYASDYEIVTKLKTFSDRYGICLLVVHHTRKMEAEDSFDMISGTNGLLGAADGAFIMQKKRRTDNTALLDIVGRDQPDQELTLEFNRERCVWEFQGAETELWKLPPDPLLEAVAKMLTPEQPEWSGAPTELLERLSGVSIQANILTRKLNVSADRLYNDYGIRYESRRSLNVVYRDEPIQKVYHELFDEAVNRYNAKQKRKDRCITDYYEHLRTGKQEKLFHELIVQIGNKDDMGVLTENGALAKELLDEYMQGFQERNPTLRVFGAFLHMDEATPHLHIDFVPYVSGWKGKGLDTKVSLKQALKALGFAGGSKRESELNQWINAEKEQLAAVMERHGIEWEQKGTHEEHLSVLDFKKQERSKEVAALEAAKQEYQTDLTEMQEQLETAQTAVEAAEQRVQKAELTYQKQSQKLNKLAPIMEGLENLSAQYSQRPEEWVPEAATFETAKSYREKKAMPLIQKLVKVLFALHRKYWEVKDERDKYLHFYQDEKKATHHLSQRLKEVEAENSQLYAMKRDFRRVWNYFGAEKMQQVIGLMRGQEQTADRSQKKNRQNSVEL